MSSAVEPTAPDPAREELERQKLRADIAGAARASEKAGYEIEEIKARLAGKEPHWKWQRAQHFVAIAGIIVSAGSLFFAYRTFQQSVDEAHRKNLQSAAEHLQNGWPSGALELSYYGDEGLAILVYDVDATNRTVQKSWPVVTLAALEQIDKKKKRLTSQERARLTAGMIDNDAMMGAKFPEIVNPANDAQRLSVDAAIASLRDYACVQLALQRVLDPAKPPNWANTEGVLKAKLSVLPQC